MGVLEWLLGIGLVGYAASEHHKQKKYEKEEAEYQRMEYEEAERLKQEEESELQRKERQELIRRNTVCLFQDGLPRDEFETIAKRECRRIRRVSEVEVDGPVIQGTVRTSSGISEWEFIIDFNNFGHITGKYWLWSDNDDSTIPGIIAENICEAIRSHKTESRYRSYGNDKKSDDDSTAKHISYCPYCGSKQYISNPRFCMNCGMQIPGMADSSGGHDEGADTHDSNMGKTNFTEGTGTTNARGSTDGADTMEGTRFTHGSEDASDRYERAARMIPKIAVGVTCSHCGASTLIRTFRKFVRCPYCGGKIAFPGFLYKDIDRSSEKYSDVKYWMSCPSCRGENMCLWPSSNRWICQDCGYSITEQQRLKGTFWFCDNCEAYMNVQKGFISKKSRLWKCTECGFENDVSYTAEDK